MLKPGNTLGRLSRTLAGAGHSPPVVPPTLRPPRAARAPTGEPTLLTAGNPPQTQSVRAWSNQLAPSGPSEATIHYRLKQGWSDPQALGLAPPPPRDRTAEQAAHALAHARVIIFEPASDGTRRVLSRLEVATRLGIKLKSVAQKLRAHRPAGGGQAWVPLDALQRRS